MRNPIENTLIAHTFDELAQDAQEQVDKVRFDRKWNIFARVWFMIFAVVQFMGEREVWNYVVGGIFILAFLNTLFVVPRFHDRREDKWKKIRDDCSREANLWRNKVDG